jgi:hypothetical protein
MPGFAMVPSQGEVLAADNLRRLAVDQEYDI